MCLLRPKLNQLREKHTREVPPIPAHPLLRPESEPADRARLVYENWWCGEFRVRARRAGDSTMIPGAKRDSTSTNVHESIPFGPYSDRTRSTPPYPARGSLTNSLSIWWLADSRKESLLAVEAVDAWRLPSGQTPTGDREWIRPAPRKLGQAGGRSELR